MYTASAAGAVQAQGRSGAGAVEAQGRPLAPLSIQVSAGVFDGRTNGAYVEDQVQGPVFEALVAIQLGALAGGVAVVGLGGSVYPAVGDRKSVCVITPSGCAPHFPTVASGSLLGGIESSNRTLRAFTGPAATWADQPGRGSGVDFGWAARIEAAASLHPSVAAVASLHGLLIPSRAGDAFHFLTASVGLRLR